MALKEYAELYFQQGQLASMLRCRALSWKTSRSSKLTRVMTPFGRMFLPQLEVKDKDTGRRYYITRLLLGIDENETDLKLSDILSQRIKEKATVFD